MALICSDPHDYYNGNPPTLEDIFEESGGLDLELQLGIRDPGRPTMIRGVLTSTGFILGEI